ncbi:MAG: hypothetical protein QOJ54_1025 [Aliidongia sp.]|nr:hypothetical protein [Aliidongia sp.]
MSNVAKKIFAKFGGPERLARLFAERSIKIHRSGIHKWGYPKSRGGRGGVIPTKWQQPILNLARELGIDLSPADFFETEDMTDAA